MWRTVGKVIMSGISGGRVGAPVLPHRNGLSNLVRSRFSQGFVHTSTRARALSHPVPQEPIRHSPSVRRHGSLPGSETGAGASTFFPSGDVCDISIPDRMRMITWLAHHNAIDLSFFNARAKRTEPLGPEDARPLDYSWVELTLRLSDPNATRLRDVFRQASRPDALRSGRLLEVLDCFSGDIAFSYCRPTITLNESKTDLFVTVAIDSIRLFDQEAMAHADVTSKALPYISVTRDLTLRGFVSHAGTSSLEITAELHQVCRCPLLGVL